MRHLSEHAMPNPSLTDTLLANIHQLLAPLRPNRSMWLETVVITLGALALGALSQSDDPLQAGGVFPWIWLAPILIALRYGMAAGTMSSLILVIAWGGNDYMSARHADFPEQFFLGGLIAVMLCGEFSDLWETRLRRATETNHYLDERLSRITDRHLLLRLSHDRMEQEILTKPVTLRDALRELRQLAAAHNHLHLPAADALLQLLMRYSQLESAAIFTASAKGRYERVSQIGSPPDLPNNDRLLACAMERQSLSHLLLDELSDKELPSPFLVIAPILTSAKHLLGILAVERMPFLALNEENLQMLSVLLSYYADCVNEAEGTKRFLELFPAAPPDFAAEFPRVLQLQRTHGINSYVVVLAFEDDETGRQAIARILLSRRGQDIPWPIKLGHRLLLANLMPLANDAAVEGYLLRTETALKSLSGFNLDTRPLSSFRIGMADSDPMAGFKRLFEMRHD